MKIWIRDENDSTRFHNTEGDVILTGLFGDALVYIESERTISIVHHAHRFNGTPRTIRGREYYWHIHAINLPHGFDAEHWITLMQLGLP